MKNIVVYDSQYGNTKKIAQAIAKGISAKAISVNDVKTTDLKGAEIVVVGSPTQGGRATPAVQKFIDSISQDILRGKKIAVFDTRFLESDLNFALKMLVRTIGYAAPKMADALTAKGCKLSVAPEGFIVKGKEGPLAAGEFERAEKWVGKI